MGHMLMGKNSSQSPQGHRTFFFFSLSKSFCKAFPKIRFLCSLAEKAGKKLQGSDWWANRFEGGMIRKYSHLFYLKEEWKVPGPPNPADAEIQGYLMFTFTSLHVFMPYFLPTLPRFSKCVLNSCGYCHFVPRPNRLSSSGAPPGNRESHSAPSSSRKKN